MKLNYAFKINKGHRTKSIENGFPFNFPFFTNYYFQVPADKCTVLTEI